MTLHIDDVKERNRMRYTFIKQHDATDCAAACMGMVCLHYRKETTITKLSEYKNLYFDLENFNLMVDYIDYLSIKTNVKKSNL